MKNFIVPASVLIHTNGYCESFYYSYGVIAESIEKATHKLYKYILSLGCYSIFNINGFNFNQNLDLILEDLKMLENVVNDDLTSCFIVYDDTFTIKSINHENFIEKEISLNENAKVIEVSQSEWDTINTYGHIVDISCLSLD